MTKERRGAEDETIYVLFAPFDHPFQRTGSIHHDFQMVTVLNGNELFELLINMGQVEVAGMPGLDTHD